MTVHRPTRISTTDEAIRDAVTAELSIDGHNETDIATIAHNVCQRVMYPEKVSDITGMEEDDQTDNITHIRKLRRRMPRIPGYGSGK